MRIRECQGWQREEDIKYWMWKSSGSGSDLKTYLEVKDHISLISLSNTTAQFAKLWNGRQVVACIPWQLLCQVLPWDQLYLRRNLWPFLCASILSSLCHLCYEFQQLLNTNITHSGVMASHLHTHAAHRPQPHANHRLLQCLETEKDRDRHQWYVRCLGGLVKINCKCKVGSHKSVNL